MNRIPTAKEMSSHLLYLSFLLCQEELILPHSKVSLDSTSANLRKQGNLQSWGYSIGVREAIEFVPIESKKLELIAPRLYIQVAVKPIAKIPPFTQLNTTIEVWDISRHDLQSRWHIDLAKIKYQERWLELICCTHILNIK